MKNEEHQHGNVRIIPRSDRPTNRFSLVGQRRPAWFYAKANPMRHAIYDRVIAILENRSLQHDKDNPSALAWVLIPKIREVLSAEGLSELEIEQGESLLIDSLEDHPRWTVHREVPRALYHLSKREGREDVLSDHRIVAVPNLILNALLCEKLLTMFRRADLLATPGFVLRDGGLRLDLEPYLARQGFILPVISKGLIDGLKVFRWPGDSRPFVLRSREVSLDA